MLKSSGGKGESIRSICRRMNNDHLGKPEDYVVSVGSVHKYVEDGKAGTSPVKRGIRPMIPAEFLRAANAQASYLQCSGGIGECEKSTMLATMSAMVAGSVFEDKFSFEYAWKKLRRTYPKTLVPKDRLDHEDRRAEWLTFQNINCWLDGGKKFLIEMGIAIDEECVFQVESVFLFSALFYFILFTSTTHFIFRTSDGTKSEISFVHPDDILRFVNMDETAHPLSTTGMKGAPK